jgi:hypothetical protein
VRSSSADKMGRKPVQIIGARLSGGGPGPDYVAYVVVFLGAIIICRVSKLYLSDQAQVTLHMIASPSDLLLTHCGRVTKISVFNTVKLGTSASSS